MCIPDKYRKESNLSPTKEDTLEVGRCVHTYAVDSKSIMQIQMNFAHILVSLLSVPVQVQCTMLEQHNFSFHFSFCRAMRASSPPATVTDMLDNQNAKRNRPFRRVRTNDISQEVEMLSSSFRSMSTDIIISFYFYNSYDNYFFAYSIFLVNSNHKSILTCFSH